MTSATPRRTGTPPFRSLTFLLAAALLAAPAFGRGWSSTPGIVVEGDGVVYFTQDSQRHLWRTDGTAAGTRKVDLGDAEIQELATMGGKVYALARQDDVTRLLASDGVRAAGEVVALERMAAWGLTAAGSRLFFFTRETAIPGCVRLWTSDGTTDGTRVVAALFTDDTAPLAATPERLLFQLYRGPYEYGERTNYDTWSTDGSADGTSVLLPRRQWFRVVGNVAYFHHEQHLWRTDGTAAGTYSLGHFYAITADAGTTYLTTRNEQPARLLRTDGSREGTTLVRTFDDPLHYLELQAVIGERFLFFQSQYGGSRLELRVAAGDGALQTVQTFERRPRRWSASYEMPRVLRIGDVLFFLIAGPRSNDLWRTDGTAAGTTLMKSFPQPAEPENDLPRLYRAGERLLLWSYDPVYGTEPFVSDGTPEGTYMLANLATEGTIRGEVTDAADGRAIAGATIEVHVVAWDGTVHSHGTTVTDEEGAYVFDGVFGSGLVVQVRPPREYVAQIHGAPACTRCKVTDGKRIDVPRDSVVDVDFAVERGARFAGRVTDENGAPLAGVTINVAESIDAPVFGTATTETDGRYVTPAVPAGHSWIVYTSNHPGRSAVIFDGASCSAGCENAGPVTRIGAAAGEIRHAVDFRLLPFGKMKLTFVDTVTGEPVASRVSVRVWSVKPHSRGWATVYKDCYASSECVVVLPDGKYWIEAHASDPRDHAPVWYPDVECGGDWCDPRTPQGTIVAPVAGQTVTLELRMRPLAARIAGRVREAESGRPIAFVPVEVVNAKGSVVAKVFTRHDGSYESFALLRSGVEYFVRTEPTETHVAKMYDGGNGILCRWNCVPMPGAMAIAVQDLEVRRGVDFRLERTASISVSVTDAVTGASIDQAEIRITNAAGESVWFPSKRAANGVRTILGIYPGTYTLVPSNFNGWAPADPRTFTVTFGDRDSTDWTLQPACRVKLSPPGIVVPAAGGTFRLGVGGNCGFVTPASAGWAYIVSGVSLTYEVEPNRGPERVHHFVFPAAVFTIRQEAAP